MNDIVETFKEIVQIDSPSGEEDKMSHYLENFLKDIGFKYTKDKTGSILTTNFNNPKLLICAHMDTVEPGRNITPVVKNKYIEANGKTILGADNKAAVSAIMYALKSFINIHGKLPNIEILFTVKEETGGGLEFFPLNLIKSKQGVTFDYAQPIGKIIISSPYIYNFKILFTGKAAHASQPDDGVNSLLPAIKFIESIPNGKIDDGKTTINVGQVNSGSGINIVPEKTTVFGEIRSTSKSLFNNHLKAIKTNATKISKEFALDLDFKVDGYCPGYEYSHNDPLIKKIKDIYSSLNIDTGYDKSAGISDANILIGAGIKTVNLSDGCENPHTTIERISIDNLKSLQAVVLKTIEQFTD